MACRTALLRSWFHLTNSNSERCCAINRTFQSQMKTGTVHNLRSAIFPAIFYSENATTKRVDDKKKTHKKDSAVKITVIHPDGNLSVTSLEEAEKIAKRRDMKLLKIDDKLIGSQRPLYKITPAKQYFEEELRTRKEKSEKKKTEIKGEKLMSISDKIETHDLEAKLKMMKKWLEKKYEVRVIINESEESLAASVYKRIDSTKNEMGKIVQKQQKGREIRFIVLPVKKEDSST